MIGMESKIDDLTAANPKDAKRTATRSGARAGLVLACTVGLLALPSAVLAFTVSFDNPPKSAAEREIVPMDAQSNGADFASAIPLRSLAKGQLFPFTPAETPDQPDRAVTVAVRVDAATAKAITVLGRARMASGETDTSKLRIASSAFNLGVSRGYRGFSQDLVANVQRKPSGELPDLGSFSLNPGGKPDGGRFSPRISIDEKQTAGRAPRTFAGEAGEVDLGGAYRVTKNLDVTAGVRYSQDRERLVPLTDGKQDSQAVYVGTQFKF
jgi:opacity protein-like surface antigen